MLATELITADFPYIRADDTIKKAIQLCIDNCICHLAVVGKNMQMVGILPAEILLGIENRNSKVAELKDDFIHMYAYKGHHGLDVFELISRMELTSIPVIDENSRYIGTIVTQNLLSTLGNYYSFKQPGGIFVLSLGLRDYNLSEISRIVESNNAKILLLYMDINEPNASIRLTIKINTLDVERIVATFERFNYTIEYYQPADVRKDAMQERYDLLMKLFDIK